MNRIVSAVMLSGLLVAAPAFAKTVAHKSVATAGDKAAGSGDAAKSDVKTDAAAPAADASSKPVKKVKKSKKTTTETKTDAPAEAPAK